MITDISNAPPPSDVKMDVKPLASSATTTTTTINASISSSSSSSTSPPPSLATSSGSDVGAYLATVRFASDAKGLEDFVKGFLSAPSMPSQQQSSQQRQASPPVPPPVASASAPPSFGSLLYTAPNVQLIAPRGRMDMSVYEQGLRFVTAKGDAFVVGRDDAGR